MKRGVYIAALVLLYLLFASKSCDNRERSDETLELARLSAARDSIAAFFTPDTLTSESLRAFEKSALARFRDFCDYRSVLSDTSVDSAFRAKAAQLIHEMLVSGTRLEDLPDNLSGDSVWIRQPLLRNGAPEYTATLGYVSYSDSTGGYAGRQREIQTGTVDFLLIKQCKVFGADTLQAWQVFFRK